ncbi:uncharacterized protein BDR25DRAFT_376050 [Lindgomyces ingoldianus]|uniref:Uncharacterized protein n=1 Tax=Lindgomyces ingoldianus TaxID=673940 RepID=A0ACB6QJL6_9PLEO|nr:uncharacterized protein BDR25DRAFT_376050 [Lindgomyces ingoldianus]KAF2467188.1 hypothetical protein BDR25DRAFT_376050 [Lindgomyces ingoldianus]
MIMGAIIQIAAFSTAWMIVGRSIAGIRDAILDDHEYRQLFTIQSGDIQLLTVFNFAFTPTVYFFYPETAGRTLEDIDRFFTGDARLLVFKDNEAISEQRPDKFVQHKHEEIKRNSSIVPADSSAATEVHHRATLEREEMENGKKENYEDV